MAASEEEYDEDDWSEVVFGLIKAIAAVFLIAAMALVVVLIWKATK